MRRVLAVFMLMLAPTALAAAERISLEDWRMARRRIGKVVEFSCAIINSSKTDLSKVVVTGEFYSTTGRGIARTSPVMLDNQARPIPGRYAGVIRTLPAGRRSRVRVFASQVPVFATYKIKVRYEVGGEKFEEIFEGGEIDAGAPERAVDELLEGRVEVRIVSREMTSVPGPNGTLRDAVLTMTLKNVGALEATGLAATLDLRGKAGSLKKKTYPLNPPRLGPGERRTYRIEVGSIPMYDGFKISLKVDTPAGGGGGPTEVAPGPADEVHIAGMTVEKGDGRLVLKGTVRNGLKRSVTGVTVTVEFYRGGRLAKKTVIDAVAAKRLSAGDEATFTHEVEGIDRYDELATVLSYETIGG